MTTLKKILRNQILRRLLCWLIALYIRLVHVSGGWKVIGGQIPGRLWDQGKPFIACFWHGRLLMMPYNWDRRAVIHTLVSQHPDGQLIARVIGHFGFRTVAGSTTRGGTEVLRAMLTVLEEGDCIGITPDGPRGPRMRVSDGVVALARISGAPVVPVTFAARRRMVLSTWDRFVVPLPFGRGVLMWGDPIEVSDGAGEREAQRLHIEDRMIALTREADRLCGCPAVEPQPAVSEAAP